MTKIFVPSGEIGSVNWFARRIVDGYSRDVILEISMMDTDKKQGVILNIMLVLTERGGSDVALKFAEDIIKDFVV